MVLKWGIAGAGKISAEFARAIAFCKDQGHELIAVASQDIERASTFANKFNVNKVYGSYKELALDKQIDVVYVGNLNPQHLAVSTLMLQHDKHVLCEKPLTLNEKQTIELITTAKTKKKFFMEAVWSRCFPAYEKLREFIQSDGIGDVLYAHATFGLPLANIERLSSKEMGGGTILDLGIYTLQFAQFVFNDEEPVSVTAKGHLNVDGIDESANAILTYSGGKTAVMSTNARVALPNEAVICGTKGIIKIPRFWSPSKIFAPEIAYNFELPKSDLGFTFKNFVGLSYEVLEVGKCIKAGLLESPKMTHKQTVQLARLMDKVRQQVGVKYECD